MTALSIEKFCWSCKAAKPIATFPKNRSKPDGLGTECKDCRRIQGAAYHTRNRDKYLAQSKAYRKAHLAQIKQAGREYYQQNKSKMAAQSAARYRAKSAEILAQQKQRRDGNLGEFRVIEHQRYWANPERARANGRRHYKNNATAHNEKAKQYQAANPDKVKEWKRRWLTNHPDKRRVAAGNNRDMRRRKGIGRFTLDQLLAKYAFHGWRCYLCRVPITLKTSHPDHRKPLGRGGTNWIANIAPACIKCNLKKNRRTESEFRALMAA